MPAAELPSPSPNLSDYAFLDSIIALVDEKVCDLAFFIRLLTVHKAVHAANRSVNHVNSSSNGWIIGDSDKSLMTTLGKDCKGFEEIAGSISSDGIEVS